MSVQKPADHWAADEVVAPNLVALKAWYDSRRPKRRALPLADLPMLETLPGAADLALVAVSETGDFIYERLGAIYEKLSGQVVGQPETRRVPLQHLGLALRKEGPFHVSITRFEGPRILQYDRLILPLSGEGGHISHLLIGECFLRVAKDASPKDAPA